VHERKEKMEVKAENNSRRGGVADYFTVLGVGERLTWQHTKKKSGLVPGDDEHDEEESEAELMERFYREIMEVAIVASDLESTSISQVPSFADDATVSSQTNSVFSVPTPIGKPKRTPLSPPNSDVVATVTGTESISGKLSMRDLDGFTTIQNTCPAGRSSTMQDQGSVSSSGANESLSGSTVHESALWYKSQVFDANLDPCFGFRADVLAKVLQDSEHTPLKQLGRKVGSTIRQQLGPLLPSRDRRSDKPSMGFRFHLAFRRRAPDEKDRPAIANIDLRYVRIHRDTVYLPRTKPIDVFSESFSKKSTSLRRGLATGATIAARVAEASRQKFLEKYRERYDAPGRTNASQNHSLDGTELESSDKILVALEDLIQVPDGFEQWSIPEPFRWIQIPSKVKDEPVRSSSSILGGRKTHVYSFNAGVYQGIDNVLSEDNATQVSDPSGVGFEAYFTGSSFILTPPSSAAGASDIGSARHFSPRAAGVLVGQTEEQERTKSFEVLDPNAYMPNLLDVDNLPDLSHVTTYDQYLYVPLLAFRRQRVGNEERYHEDSAVVDMAVSFRDVSGDPVLPDVLGNDDDEDETFNILNTTNWTCASRIIVPIPDPNHVTRTLGSPVILMKRNQPIGFADAAFATSVLDRFPMKNYKGLPLPEEELPMFCYPTGCRLYRTKYSDCPLPQYFGFVVKVCRLVNAVRAPSTCYLNEAIRTNKVIVSTCPVSRSWSL
jgi:uDENN domain